MSVLWRIPGHGFLITRLETYGNRRELVLVAWAGVDTGPLVLHAQGVCKAEGIETIRFHTAHNEQLISRFVKKWGFQRVETLFRWVA